ncbi:hypothetical protein phi1422_0068 [Bdellovibrio phage phi1422]|uniref:hypothetical protein n=1 Tax=Bdellovibrio phage phi1422 TaxID=1127515 RepID=UPI0002536D78|nr:hypothetical protein F395_gp68 [Bdellovibrio phage phi1422]AFC22588.1 hypothetical protein phi1422_0068 [Bdellovibrio phage phi1422]
MKFMIAFIIALFSVTMATAQIKGVDGKPSVNFINNAIKNPSAEINALHITKSVTASASRDTDAADAPSWNLQSVLNGAYVEWDLLPLTAEMKSGNCAFSGNVKGNGALWAAQVLDASNNVLSFTQFQNTQGSFVPFSVPYTCADVGARKVRIAQNIAGTAEPINVNNLKYGQWDGKIGSPDYGWRTYTGTVTADTGTFPTYTLQEMQERRSNGKLYLKGRLTLTGTNTWSSIRIPAPSGIVMGTNVPMSILRFSDIGSNTYKGSVTSMNTSYAYVASFGGTNGAAILVNQSSPFTWASGDVIDWNIGPIDVVGWEVSFPAVTAQNWNFDWRDCPSGFDDNWTNTTVTCKWKRDGGQGYFQYKVLATGVPTGGSIALTLPTGISQDSSRMIQPPGGNYVLPGDVNILDNGSRFFQGTIASLTSTTFTVNALQISPVSNVWESAITPSSPMSWVSGDALTINVNFPVSENGVSWTETWNALQLNQTVYADTSVKAEKSAGLTSVDYGTSSVAVSNVANATSITSPTSCTYMRVGDVVTASCNLITGCTTAAGTLTQLSVVPPVATTNGVTIQGTVGTGVSGESGRIISTGNNILVQYFCRATGAGGKILTFTYKTQ